ncbi:LacI family DNA-binding transcriptional regulator [Microlunatus ginsengisoli]|uniref:LacI family DNA-binding transcriptional regulator n=1 Tax=Microlunatus ginsengisoli TaxID=363863 RepID=A0ABP6ZBE5_9ACTN
MSDRPPPKVVTRADVARLAGVSTAVVSYVVNGGPRPVAPHTATRVRDAIAILGYRPNLTARALKLGTSGVLGLLVPDSSNPFYAELGLEIERATSAKGLALLLASSNSDRSLESRLIGDLAGRQLDGLVVAGTAGPPIPGVGRVPRVSTPIVYLDTPVPVPGYTTLSSNAQQGATLLTEHLRQVHGHKSVALLMGTHSQPWRDGRELGWQLAARNGNAADPPIIRVPFTREGGYEGGLQLLTVAAKKRARAVLASSDLQAVGLLRAAHELGIRVPEDLAIVAYDGTEESEYSWPPLTCARQRVRDIAETAVQVIVDQAEPSHQTFDIDLVIRRSCGCTPTS